MFGYLFNVINDMFFNKTFEENEKTNYQNKLEETIVRKDNRNSIYNNGGDE